jgi:tRNA(Ile)-lysidine synthase
VPEAGIVVEAVRIQLGTERAESNPDLLLDTSLLSNELKVRNWRPGDRFWPAHTKSPKKIKELLQEHHITGPERKMWPVVTNGSEIVWVRGFPAPAALRAKDSGNAILIRDLPLEED